MPTEKEAPNPAIDYKRQIMGILMNWPSYAPMVENADLQNKRVIPFSGKYFSPLAFWEVVQAVPEPKRSSLLQYCIYGKTQSQIARDREVTQTQIWWELGIAFDEVKRRLEE